MIRGTSNKIHTTATFSKAKEIIRQLVC